jgi:phage host-nuclease inhibitor protein Gam
MKKIREQMVEINPPSDSLKSEIEEVIRSLQDINREIEKLATEKDKR